MSKRNFHRGKPNKKVYPTFNLEGRGEELVDLINISDRDARTRQRARHILREKNKKAARKLSLADFNASLPRTKT